MKETIEKSRKTGAKVLDALLCRSGQRQSPILEEAITCPPGQQIESTSDAETQTESMRWLNLKNG